LLKKYPSLLSPIQIGNVLFKNRLIAARSSPKMLQSTEPYPTEATIVSYANKAKNGAAIVTCGGVGMPHNIPTGALATFDKDTVLPGSYDPKDLKCQRRLAQLAEAIHFFGGKASMQIGGFVPVKYDVSTGIPVISPYATTSPRTGEEIPAEILQAVAEDFVYQAVSLKSLGFDMVYLHMAYRFTILGRILSPLTNKRKDEYGGSLENMARFPIMVADSIKSACGRDFIIEASLSGDEPAGGRTLEETIKLAKLLAGHIDILQLRAQDLDPAHPAGFNPERTPFLYMAEAVKKNVAGIAVSTVGGYLDPEVSEEIIASSKADFIAMARAWISNPDYGKLLDEGRSEDLVPCIRCNYCINPAFEAPPISTCSVNPIWGLEDKIDLMISPPTKKKRVAIIGGGPAGMKAALVAAERGHAVTLYEKSDVLGGLFKTMDYVSFKWPQREYKDWLIRQILKSGIKVIMNTDPLPAMLKKEEYDAAIIAVGAEPIAPKIPGFGNEDKLEKDIVVIGGGEVGTETGMHLAEKGHHVTVIEMTGKLAANAAPIHYWQLFRQAWEKLPNFHFILNARCKSIARDEVIYIDAGGKEHSINAGSIVISVGMKPKSDMVIKYVGTADKVMAIGDCNVVGNLQKATRSAYSISSML
jgi:2,4-dienoyl-CoA reductase-like NADH-dependent reductase (Old Yellow Enzyme family)/thioredoxin reductase